MENWFNYKGVDFARREREDLTEEFIKYYAYFVSGNIVRHKGEVRKRFVKIRGHMIDLSKRGSMKALAFYLFNEEQENLDKNLVAVAKAIESKPSYKTPEEWEVIAGLHINDRVYVMINGIETTKELNRAVAWAWAMFNELEYERDHGRTVNFYTGEKHTKDEFDDVVTQTLRRFGWLCERMRETDFGRAIAHAQIGHYGRYLRSQDVSDMWQYLEVTKSSYDICLPRETMKNEFSVDYIYGLDNFKGTLDYLGRKEAREKFFAKLSGKAMDKKYNIDTFPFAMSMKLLMDANGYISGEKYCKRVRNGVFAEAFETDEVVADLAVNNGKSV